MPRHRLLLLAILALYLLITLAYGVVNPLFEAPDEQLHYFTAQYVADTGRLPAVTMPPNSLMGQEAAQPPLYYLLTGWLIRPVDTNMDRAAAELWFNPYVRLGDAASPTNRNAFVHPPAEGWPWAGQVLAGHGLRGAAALLGLGTLLCIYGAGRVVWPADPGRALLAVALVAFLPQFNFLHSAISNDPLIVLLSAAALAQLLWWWVRGGGRWRLLLLGLTLGLAILSKMAGLLLLLYALGFVALRALRDGATWRQGLAAALRDGLWLLLPAGAVAGWLLWRNWALYGDVTATSQFIALAGGDRGYTLAQVLGESGGLLRSLVAVFGWMNVAPPGWVYGVWAGLGLLALGGGVLTLAGRAVPRPGAGGPAGWRAALASGWFLALLLALWVGLVYAGLVQFMRHTPAAQGRLLFPALLPLALGLAWGLAQLRRHWLLVLAPLLALATTLYSLWFVVRPAYAYPPLIALADIPAGAQWVGQEMGQGLTLLAAELETTETRPGEVVWVTLYWQGTAAPQAAPELVLELFGREWALVGKLQTYHGGGLYPANLWPAGGVVADRVGVRLDDALATPVVAPLQVRLVDGGEPLVVGVVKVAGEMAPAGAEVPLLGQFGEGIGLLRAELAQAAARPGAAVGVAVTWRVLAPAGGDYTTFVHLGDPTQPPLATGDAPPLQGHYPTRYWAAGEVIEDSYEIVLPADLAPGRYPVWLGLYNESGRLPLTVDGQRQGNDAYLVGWLVVGP